MRFFFCEYLPQHRGLSRHTQASYAVALRLLVERVGSERGPHELTAAEVLEFLAGLERERGNSAGTRNARLAALNCLWKALTLWDPAHRDAYVALGAVPSKRCRQRSPDAFEVDELQRLFQLIDTRTSRGFRDQTILRYMYNTGSRISEVVDAQTGWLSLGDRAEVTIRGKGGKARVCPLLKTTAELLRIYLQRERGPARPGFEECLFLSRRGRGFSRAGLWKLLHGYFGRVQAACPSLAGKRLAPHSLRHTTAIYLLRAGVDVTVIKAWLGHADVSTTSRYLDLDMDQKREALDRFLGLDVERLAPGATARPAVLPANIVEWLEKL
ncbi:MAG: integrase/recombinase [Candidatus Rokubacteria bacterium]|nr:integrase/recombinase [Candidatus Rokubacteria bacterium]